MKRSAIPPAGGTAPGSAMGLAFSRAEEWHTTGVVRRCRRGCLHARPRSGAPATRSGAAGRANSGRSSPSGAGSESSATRAGAEDARSERTAESFAMRSGEELPALARSEATGPDLARQRGVCAGRAVASVLGVVGGAIRGRDAVAATDPRLAAGPGGRRAGARDATGAVAEIGPAPSRADCRADELGARVGGAAGSGDRRTRPGRACGSVAKIGTSHPGGGAVPPRCRHPGSRRCRRSRRPRAAGKAKAPWHRWCRHRRSYPSGTPAGSRPGNYHWDRSMPRGTAGRRAADRLPGWAADVYSCLAVTVWL